MGFEMSSFPIRALVIWLPCAPHRLAPCSTSRVVPRAHVVVGSSTGWVVGPGMSIRQAPSTL
jgi:hypothetical protein